jgi:hypothetical protein
MLGTCNSLSHWMNGFMSNVLSKTIHFLQSIAMNDNILPSLINDIFEDIMGSISIFP